MDEWFWKVCQEEEFKKRSTIKECLQQHHLLHLKHNFKKLEILLHKPNLSSDWFTVRLCVTNPANSQNQRVWAVHGSSGTSRHSSRALTLTGSNCWPADSKEPLEQLTVQTVGSRRRGEVGNVSLESTYPHSILALLLQLTCERQRRHGYWAQTKSHSSVQSLYERWRL